MGAVLAATSALVGCACPQGLLPAGEGTVLLAWLAWGTAAAGLRWCLAGRRVATGVRCASWACAFPQGRSCVGEPSARPSARVWRLGCVVTRVRPCVGQHAVGPACSASTGSVWRQGRRFVPGRFVGRGRCVRVVRCVVLSGTSFAAGPAVGAAPAAASAAAAFPLGTKCAGLRSAPTHRSVLAASAAIRERPRVRGPAVEQARPASTTCVCHWAASLAGQSPAPCLATVQTSRASCAARKADVLAAAPAAQRTTAAMRKACVRLWTHLSVGRSLRRAATGSGEGTAAGATGSSSLYCLYRARRMRPLWSTTWTSRLQLEDLFFRFCFFFGPCWLFVDWPGIGGAPELSQVRCRLRGCPSSHVSCACVWSLCAHHNAVLLLVTRGWLADGRLLGTASLPAAAAPGCCGSFWSGVM